IVGSNAPKHLSGLLAVFVGGAVARPEGAAIPIRVEHAGVEIGCVRGSAILVILRNEDVKISIHHTAARSDQSNHLAVGKVGGWACLYSPSADGIIPISRAVRQMPIPKTKINGIIAAEPDRGVGRSGKCNVKVSQTGTE